MSLWAYKSKTMFILPLLSSVERFFELSHRLLSAYMRCLLSFSLYHYQTLLNAFFQSFTSYVPIPQTKLADDGG